MPHFIVCICGRQEAQGEIDKEEEYQDGAQQIFVEQAPEAAQR